MCYSLQTSFINCFKRCCILLINFVRSHLSNQDVVWLSVKKFYLGKCTNLVLLFVCNEKDKVIPIMYLFKKSDIFGSCIQLYICNCSARVYFTLEIICGIEQHSHLNVEINFEIWTELPQRLSLKAMILIHLIFFHIYWSLSAGESVSSASVSGNQFLCLH